MKAVVVDRFGGPEVMRVTDRAQPRPGPRQLGVRVRACGVCRHDALTRAGAFPKIALPVILGHQVTGIVEDVGSDVSGFRRGQRVMSMQFESCGQCDMCMGGAEAHCRQRPKFLGEDIDGGYAEYMVADYRAWIPLPDALTFEMGAVLTCVLGTAYHAIVTRAQARAGETAVLTGASGGVGTHAMQVLRLCGVRTLAITSSPAKVQELRDAGADEVITAEGGRFGKQVKAVTHGLGADFAIDVVGGEALLECIHAVRPQGRVVVLGNVAGGKVALPPAYLILKEVSLIGTKSITRAELGTLLSLVERGLLTPRVARTLPLDQAARAHSELEDNSESGRTVLTVS